MDNVYDYGVLMPEATDFSLIPQTLQDKITSFSAEWPAFPAINTRFYNGYGIVYMRLKVKLSKADFDSLIAQFGLDWTLLGIRSAYKIVDTVTEVDAEGNDVIVSDYDIPLALPRDGSILNFANDITEVDLQGNVITRRPTADDNIYIPTYAGTDSIKL